MQRNAAIRNRKAGVAEPAPRRQRAPARAANARRTGPDTAKRQVAASHRDAARAIMKASAGGRRAQDRRGLARTERRIVKASRARLSHDGDRGQPERPGNRWAG